MKRIRNIIILVAVLVVVCVVIVVEKAVTRHVDSINTTDEIILSIAPDDLTAASWSNEDGELSFAKTDGVWQDAGDAAFPVNQDTLTDFLDHFSEVHATFIIDDVADYDQYGLENPECTITLTGADGDTVVSLGGYSTMDAQRYVSIGDGRVFLVEDDLLEYVSVERDDFMQMDEIPAFDNLTELKVQGDTDLDIVYDEEGVYAYTSQYNYYQIDQSGHQYLDDALTESYLSSLQGLDLSNYVTYTASDEDLSQYGLDAPAYTLTFTGTKYVTDADEETTDDDDLPTEDVAFTLCIGTVPVESDEESEDADDEESVIAYARLGESEIISQLSDSDYETLAAGTYDTLRPTAVLALDWDDVTGISVTIGDETYDIVFTTRGELDAAEAEAEDGTEEDATGGDADADGADAETGDADADADAADTAASDTVEEDPDTPVYLLNGQEIDLTAFTDATNAMTIDTFTTEEPERDEEISVTFSLTGAKYTSVTVNAYQYDGENCLVTLDDETLGLMARSLMVDVREAVTSIVLGLDV